MEKNRIHPVKVGKGVRMSFARQKEVLEMPNLIEVQTNSYQWFLDEGLKEVLSLLQANGIQAAVASSTSSDMVEEMLSYYGIRQMFCCVKTGSNVKRRKPYPDIYQAVLRECGVEGRNALAVEDTDTGMRAAEASRRLVLFLLLRGVLK